MTAPPAISGAPAGPALDWAALVAEGRDALAAMTDGRWTDFNAHDPGITMLESFAYALTDVGYRATHPIADLFAGAPAPAGPGELLSGRAVTLPDLRRVALDVRGVRNAWIEPSDHPTLRLRHAAGSGEIDFERRDAAGDPVRVAGVHRVLIEKSSEEDVAAAELARDVAAALHRNRGLGEDFDPVELLAPFAVAVSAEIEIDDPGRADAILLAVFAALDAYCSPPPVWLGAETLRERGWSTEAIYEGPATSGGRLEGDDDAPPRRVALQLSDVIAALDRLDGVRATRRVRIGAAGDELSGPARWSLPIPEGQVARFDPRAARIILAAGGGRALDSQARPDLVRLFGERPASSGRLRGMGDPPAPTGRDRAVAAYRPLRHDLPGIYGVSPGALLPDAAPARVAEAAQLRAYLALLDAVLANQLSQLAAAPALLGHGAERSYATRPAEAFAQPGETPVHAPDFNADALQALVEPPNDPHGIERRNRLLAHLLARHGEEAPSAPPPQGIGFGPELPVVQRVLASRSGFLSAFPRLSAARGTGANLLDADDEPAFLQRIRLKLGLSEAEGSRMRLVEHVLLRPGAEDDGQGQPLLAAAAAPDPYSLQLSLVVDDVLKPIEAALARVARSEAPAHLVLHLRWMERAAFDGFVEAYGRWRRTLCAQRREALGFGEAA